jgi:hypothetical protein
MVEMQLMKVKSDGRDLTDEASRPRGTCKKSLPEGVRSLRAKVDNYSIRPLDGHGNLRERLAVLETLKRTAAGNTSKPV